MNKSMRMILLNKQRGEEHDSNNRHEIDSRFRDRRGREHYDDGRYVPIKNGYYIEPEYDDYRVRAKNVIGFNMGGYDDSRSDSKLYYDNIRSRDNKHSGKEFTVEDAEEWVRNMKNTDGSTGEHWTMQQIKQLIAQRRLECDPIELYIALNATYSDLSKFFKKYNINNMDAYIDYAKMFWLEDEDAVDDKLAAYYMYVVK